MAKWAILVSVFAVLLLGTTGRETDVDEKKTSHENSRELTFDLGDLLEDLFGGHHQPTPFPTTAAPTPKSTKTPTPWPTTKSPTPWPTTKAPTPKPTNQPTPWPTTKAPTPKPTKQPTPWPTTKAPTPKPTTMAPTPWPTTKAPTPKPTTQKPTPWPTYPPTLKPTQYPSAYPTKSPTKFPTSKPTKSPTKFPTPLPTVSPTKSPTKFPTPLPTVSPTKSPTKFPTVLPTNSPTSRPSSAEIPSCESFPCCRVPRCVEYGNLMNLIENNLGGKGPNKLQPKNIKFDNVFPITAPGTTFTCALIENPSFPYLPIDSAQNGVRDGVNGPSKTVGQITMRTPSRIDLRCTFSQALDILYSVHDTDQGDRGDTFPEKLRICPDQASLLKAGDALDVGTDGDDCTIVRSTEAGKQTQNPFEADPDEATALTDAQKNVTSTWQIIDGTEIELRYSVGDIQPGEVLPKCCERNFFYSFCKFEVDLFTVPEEECLALGGIFVPPV